MAKFSRAGAPFMQRQAPRTNVVVVQAPKAKRSPSRARRAAGHVKRGAKRVGSAALKTAWEEKYAMASIVGSGAVGYLEGAGHLDFVPDLGMGRTPTLAIGCYVAGRMFKSQKLRQAGIGLAAAAAFQFGHDKGSKK